jgi:NADH-quinone oxidoreductase subunit F
VSEHKILLKNVGRFDPYDIKSYVSAGGFSALKKARKAGSGSIIETIKSSGLTGRGGAGFPCGVKWELAKKTKAKIKYLICNADEGEVGTFKDRYLIENNPFGLIEGMAIAAYAIGAKRGYIYLRSEYQYMRGKLEAAIGSAVNDGYLKGFELSVFMGAGAYVCGEESALMNSIEGLRGESRYKPPYPPVKGLWDMPTIINNVETLMNIPYIIEGGAEWFSSLGTKRSKGTKIFCVSGDVAKPGIYELVMGSSLKELVVDLAGARDVKAVQVGGAAGSILPASMLDTPLSHETAFGSGAVIVMNSARDIIYAVYKDILFLNDESCGKCTPCRDGSEVMIEIFERLISGEGQESDIAAIEDLSEAMSLGSLCGLGQAAAIPVMDSLKYFRADYENRITQSEFLRQYQGEQI